MNKSQIREAAAKHLFDANLDITGSTVKSVVDLMVKYGEYCARLGYRKAKVDELHQQDPLFKGVGEEEFITNTFNG
jgi:hypothetical protein